MSVETAPITSSLEDVITEDGILCSIISNLRLREAVRTSVLSTRWRHLWTHIPRLYLCAQHIFDSQTVSLIEKNKPLTLDEKSKLLEGKTDQFVGSVDSVIHQHQGLARIDEFFFYYFIREPHFHHLDAWIRAAVSAKTRVLDLDLNPTCQLSIPVVRYEFCCPPLGSSSSLEELSLTLCSVKLPRKFNGFSRLRILILLNVDISEEDITRLLSNCCTLESLWLQMAPRIVTLSIQQPQSRLRVLGVRYCYQCREIKINAINLRELYYHGYPVNFILGDLVEMEQAHITFKVENTLPRPNLVYYINRVSSNLPHLRSLSFSISDSDRKVPDLQTKTVSFLHLTHLDWLWNTSTKMTLLHLATLLDACPVLKELSLHLCTKKTLEKPPQSLRKLRKKLPKHPHAHLKTIQINEFYCDKWHIEFALYLIKNTIELESMTIKKKHSVLDEMHIENLRQEVPATVKFAIEYFQ